MYKLTFVITGVFILMAQPLVKAQTSTVQGRITAENKPLTGATIAVGSTGLGAVTDSTGFYRMENISPGNHTLQVTHIGYTVQKKECTIREGITLVQDFDLTAHKNPEELDGIVISGTMKAVSRLESPVPVEIYTPAFFKKNPTPGIFDALQNVNGVRPQLNCNICNTGDIHINGLEGPYTMVLIDGMPIVSALGTVYGLSGIPNHLVERIEIVKGPASSLYGSEAVGGLINIITQKPQNAPRVTADIFATSWQEYNADLGFKLKAGKKAHVLTGINYFNYQNKADKNHDQFTDVTLQDRISVFQKWNFERKNNLLLTIAGRYLYEDRWGGDMCWNKTYRGGDSIYGESIYTNRFELIGTYQLPVKEKMFAAFSFINHNQDSRYGNIPYIADQKVAFGQLTWDKKIDVHDLLTGLALRYTLYDDNTAATMDQPETTWLPGVFLQDEISLPGKHKLLLGFRYDHHNYHGNIFTPRVAYKWSINSNNIVRLNAGTGFRVVNLFTEDHAALTGARKVVVLDDLNPEKSYNINLNYTRKIYPGNGAFIGIDASAFYTYFNNRIVADYETDPKKILYNNLDGYAVSKGISLNTDIMFPAGLKIIAGATFMENSLTKNSITTQQMLTEKFTGTWAVSYKIRSSGLTIDYTGNLYSPMRLPVQGDPDPRKPESPWWSIQNIQCTYSRSKKFEFYGGVKNILNWTPNKSAPFIIARSHDPFGKDAASNDPLSFDTSYVYAPNQGIRGFAGIRFYLD